jgi:hypothetical protein
MSERVGGISADIGETRALLYERAKVVEETELTKEMVEGGDLLGYDRSRMARWEAIFEED